MTGILSTALTGFFVLSGLSGNTAFAQTNIQAPQEPTYQSYNVSMTAYNAVPEQTDGDPLTTASGAYSNPDIVVARSVDLADELPFGTVIAITTTGTSTPASAGGPNCGLPVVGDQIGLRVVADSMHPRKRNQIDILFAKDDTVRVGKKDMNPAIVFGVCKNIQISVVGHVDVSHMPHSQAELKIAIGKAALAVK